MTDTRQTKSQLIAEIESLRERLRQHDILEADTARAAQTMWQTQMGLLALLNSLPGMAYRTLFSPQYPKGRVEFVSAGCLALTGYPAGAYVTDITLYRQHVVHPDDRERVEKTIADAEGRQESFNLTYRIVSKDGALHWVDEHGTDVNDAKNGVRVREGFITDVTERAQHIEELRRQHGQLQLLRRMAELIPGPVLVGDADGLVLFANQAYAALTGWSMTEIVGTPMLKLARTRREQDLIRSIREVIRQGRVWQGLFHGKHADGHDFEVECTATPVTSASGDYLGSVILPSVATGKAP